MSLSRIDMFMQELNTFLNSYSEMQSNHFICSLLFSFSSRSQKKMQLVSNISFFAMFVMYFLTAIFGYLTFYGKYAEREYTWNQ